MSTTSRGSGWMIEHVDEVPPVKPDWPATWKSVRHHFNITAFGINAVSKEAGKVLIPERDADRGLVAWIDKTDQPRQPELGAGVLQDPPGGLRTEPLAPERPRDHVGDLHLVPALDRPRKQPAAADEPAGRPIDRRPKAKLGMFGVAIQEPLQLLPRLLVGQRALGKVATDLGVAV